MKKTLKIALTSCLLVLAIALSFTACKKEAYYTTEAIDYYVLQLQQLIYDSEENQENKVNDLRAEYKTKISALENANVTLEVKIRTLTAEYEKKVLELETANNTNTSTLATLKSNYEAKIAQLTAQDASNKAAIEALETEYASEVAKLEASNKANADALANHKTAYEAKVTELNGLITANATKISQLETSLSEDIAEIETIYGTKITNIEALIAELQKANKNNDDLITKLQKADTNNAEKIAALEKQMAELLSAHIHTFGAWSEYGVGDATYCSQALYYRICSQCRVLEWKNTADENPAVAHSFTEWICIKESTCAENGMEQRYCTACAYTETQATDKKQHNYESEFVAPTDKQDGYTKYECEDCPYFYKDSYVTPTSFTVTSDNRATIGFTGKENEKLIIPATFKKGDTWYRVTAIDGSAFEYCNNLTSVVIPDSVCAIGNYAFAHCWRLANITLPSNNSFYYIGEGTFNNCVMTSIKIPASVGKIASCAFEMCGDLTSITFEGTMEQWYNIGIAPSWNEFGVIERIICSDGVINIGNQGDYDEYFTYDVLPDGTYELSGIREGVTLPATMILPSTYSGVPITSIGVFAFNCDELFNVTIPTSITNIAYGAFNDCDNLTNITFEGTVAQWYAIRRGASSFPYYRNYTAVCTNGTVTFRYP